MSFDYHKYIRPGKLPHIWCPGCGHGIIMKGLIRAMDTLKLEKNNTAIVSGIGCASRISGYMDCCTLHTAHGRAAAFATGVKMAKPEMNVILVGGDGDGTAIGGNHFIHACRPKHPPPLTATPTPPLTSPNSPLEPEPPL